MRNKDQIILEELVGKIYLKEDSLVDIGMGFESSNKIQHHVDAILDIIKKRADGSELGYSNRVDRLVSEIKRHSVDRDKYDNDEPDNASVNLSPVDRALRTR
jgi:hypothetical protein